MNPLVLALSLTVTAAPVAPANTSLAIHIENPRRDLPSLREFLGNAGRYTATLQPSTIGRSLSGSLALDLLDVESLGAAGIDVDKPLTLSHHPSAQLVCFRSKKKEVLEKRLAVAREGEKRVTRKHGGATLVGVELGKGWREGYAVRGTTVCAASGGSDVLPALRAATSGMAGKGLAASTAWKRSTRGLAGAALVYASRRDGQLATALSPAGNRLDVDGRVLGKVPLLARSRAADPFAALSPEKALVALRANLHSSAIESPNGPLASSVAFLVRRACPKCPAAVETELRAMLSRQAAGPVALVVDSLDQAAARRPMPEYFLFPHAWLVQVRDPAATSNALAKAVAGLKKAGVAATIAEDGAATVPLRGRAVTVGVRGSTLYVANASSSAERALAALAAVEPKRATHAASGQLHGTALAAALSRISILDIASSPELAALFGLSIEAGPLLKALGTVEVTANPEAGGATRFSTRLVAP